MSNTHLTLQRVKNTVIKNLGNKSHILMIIYYTVIGNGNTTAFLTTMLQSKQAVVASIGRVNCAVTKYSENTAFLVQSFFCVIIERIFQKAPPSVKISN